MKQIEIDRRITTPLFTKSYLAATVGLLATIFVPSLWACPEGGHIGFVVERKQSVLVLELAEAQSKTVSCLVIGGIRSSAVWEGLRIGQEVTVKIDGEGNVYSIMPTSAPPTDKKPRSRDSIIFPIPDSRS